MEDIIKQILNKEGISYNQLIKATSGFTNLVYFVDDKLVVKLSKDEQTKKKIKKEVSIYKNIKLDCVPKYISSGNIDSYEYLIISKIKGYSLYSIWHTLSKDERQSCVKQIAGILKEFNKQDFNFLSEEYKDLNWHEHISKELISKVDLLNDMGFETGNISNFISQDLSIMFSENKYGLVYNDAHFDNFIYENGKLSLIDFDRVRVCPIDYEMLIFKTMCDNPSKFASEEDEDKIKDEDYLGVYEQFRLEYPEMFTTKNVEKRIRVYQFNYLIGQAIKTANRNWIDELLNEYKDLFSSDSLKL